MATSTFTQLLSSGKKGLAVPNTGQFKYVKGWVGVGENKYSVNLS